MDKQLKATSSTYALSTHHFRYLFVIKGTQKLLERENEASTNEEISKGSL